MCTTTKIGATFGLNEDKIDNNAEVPLRVSGNSTPNIEIPALKPHKIGEKKRVHYMCIFRQVISDVIVIASVVK